MARYGILLMAMALDRVPGPPGAGGGGDHGAHGFDFTSIEGEPCPCAVSPGEPCSW